MKTPLVLALVGLAGCAPQQQAAIPPSPTGCYMVNRGLPGLFQRYSPAPCNLVDFGRRDYGDASGGGTWAIAGPGGTAASAGGQWSGTESGWSGGGVP